jgi:hypothetical protein
MLLKQQLKRKKTTAGNSSILHRDLAAFLKDTVKSGYILLLIHKIKDQNLVQVWS